MTERVGLNLVASGAFLIYALSAYASFAVYGYFWTSTRLGEALPWYFIGQTFVKGLSAALTLLLLLLLGLLMHRRFGRVVWARLAPFFYVLSVPLGQGVNVLLHTRRIWSTSAETDWVNADEYLRSDAAAGFAALVVALVLIVGLWARWRSNQT